MVTCDADKDFWKSIWYVARIFEKPIGCFRGDQVEIISLTHNTRGRSFIFLKLHFIIYWSSQECPPRVTSFSQRCCGHWKFYKARGKLDSTSLTSLVKTDFVQTSLTTMGFVFHVVGCLKSPKVSKTYRVKPLRRIYWLFIPSGAQGLKGIIWSWISEWRVRNQFYNTTVRLQFGFGWLLQSDLEI